MIKLASKTFVPVAGDDWYQRRRQDDEGEFFRSVADQGPRKGVGGSTRQGIYCFTASGKLLAYKNAREAEVMLETLQLALRRWNALPAREKAPGAIKVPEPAKIDRAFARTPPEGGLILRTYTRILDRDDKGKYSRGSCRHAGGDLAARDHMWLTREEWQGLIPSDARVGQTFAMPDVLTRRLLRFHLADNTRGEPNYWNSSEVRKAELTWKVRSVSEGKIELELTGKALLSTDANPKEAKRGYDVSLNGQLSYDRAKKAITKFDLLAVGDHWGEGNFTRGARPGRTPLGIVFELVEGKDPAERIPPQAGRDIHGYFAAR